MKHASTALSDTFQPHSRVLNGRVLLVEDDELTGQWLMRELTQKGLTCVWAKNRPDALRQLQNSQFHAVITDVYLPDGKTGVELVKAVEPMGIPVIVITSQADLDIAKSALNQGARYLLDKPFEISRLVDLLSKSWEEPRGLTGMIERFFDLQNLTKKEREIGRLILKGLSNREIAEVMGNTEKTIKFHLTVIFQKCQVSSRTEFFNAVLPT